MTEFLYLDEKIIDNTTSTFQIDLKHPLHVKDDKTKTLTLTQYKLPPAEGRYLPPGHVILNDIYKLEKTHSTYIRNDQDAIQLLSTLLSTHNENIQKGKMEYSRLRKFHAAERVRKQTVDNKLKDSPNKLDPILRRRTWGEIVKQRKIASWVPLTLERNPDYFQELEKTLFFHPRRIGSTTTIAMFRHQKITFSREWAKIFGEQIINARDVRVVGDQTYAQRIRNVPMSTIDSSGLPTMNLLDWYCICDRVEDTFINNARIGLVDILGAGARRTRQQEADLTLGRAQRSFLRAGVYSQLNIAFVDSDGTPITLGQGLLFIKLKIEEEE